MNNYQSGELAAKMSRADTDCPYGHDQIAKRCQWMAGYWDHKNWGPKTTGRRDWRPSEIARLKEAYASVTPQVLADEMGRSRASIIHKADELGLGGLSAGRKGPTESMKRRAMDMLAKGYSIRAVAKAMHMGRKTVSGLKSL